MHEEEIYVFSLDSKLSIDSECEIKENGNTFNSLYHYILYSKAMFLDKPGLAEEILTLKELEPQKKLEEFFPIENEASWRKIVKQIAYKGCYLKFTQNKFLMNLLLDTEKLYLIYACKNDPIWGIGVEEGDERVNDKLSWEGFNWLGEVLTLLRDDFFRGLK